MTAAWAKAYPASELFFSQCATSSWAFCPPNVYPNGDGPVYTARYSTEVDPAFAQSRLNPFAGALRRSWSFTMHPKYRPDIDGLRAIAVFAVIGFTLFPVNWWAASSALTSFLSYPDFLSRQLFLVT